MWRKKTVGGRQWTQIGIYIYMCLFVRVINMVSCAYERGQTRRKENIPFDRIKWRTMFTFNLMWDVSRKSSNSPGNSASESIQPKNVCMYLNVNIYLYIYIYKQIIITKLLHGLIDVAAAGKAQTQRKTEEHRPPERKWGKVTKTCVLFLCLWCPACKYVLITSWILYTYLSIHVFLLSIYCYSNNSIMNHE